MKFEENLKTLEELVRRMQSGEMPLDDMIKAFEKGRELVAKCQAELEAIRLKIDKVTESGAVAPVEVVETQTGERDVRL